MIIEGGEASSSRPLLNLFCTEEWSWCEKLINRSLKHLVADIAAHWVFTLHTENKYSHIFQSQKFNIWSFSSINGWINIYLSCSVLYQSLWRYKYSVLFCDLQKIQNAPTKVICYRIIINDFLKTPNYLRQNQGNSLCLCIVCYHCK